MDKARNVIIHPSGEIDLIEDKKVCLSKAADLLRVNSNRNDLNVDYDPILGDKNSLDGQKDHLYELDCYSTDTDTSARIFLIMRYAEIEENLLAQAFLAQKYKLENVKPTGPILILEPDRAANDLVRFIGRQEKRRLSYPKWYDYINERDRLGLNSYVDYIDFILNFPDTNLPIRPDFYYHAGIKKH
ncbi:hypothetical protein [Pontibacter vulgaris]|uniref:hypothetical protein n=1 Tax=Pontibacter vulgaris TaxID=2905679 RepID=UPI001FA7D6E7|nr:hypothetical protein [Pontibacter vulgaris]